MGVGRTWQTGKERVSSIIINVVFESPWSHSLELNVIVIHELEYG